MELLVFSGSGIDRGDEPIVVFPRAHEISLWTFNGRTYLCGTAHWAHAGLDAPVLDLRPGEVLVAW